ncbi:Fic family protein [Riemerella anatipestifer]|uniref:Fic family protein n=1 Tax=Riemerella anatipestifer TaxID=34085 RepID=UPI0028607DEF|nr:Fic family protein [Riemerella anatipestifer]MDR7694119.1 Fic family protein [Riemerella anatipestifer]
MEKVIKEYEQLRAEYNRNIVEAFNPQDFENYINDMFTAHSCRIEGNSFSVNDTRALREQGIGLKLNNKSMLEAFEILDHFNANRYAMSNLDQPLTEDFIKKIHYYLTKNTIKFSKGTPPGEYTKFDMAVSETMFGDHKKNIAQMPKLLESTQKTLDENKVHPVVLSAMFHKFFIYLHPFHDGNGRLGRILSNFILAKKGHPLIIITEPKKERYVEALVASHKHKDTSPIVSFFFDTMIERMRNEIAEKKNLAQNFLMRFREEEHKDKRTLRR